MGDLQHFNSVRSLADGRALLQGQLADQGWGQSVSLSTVVTGRAARRPVHGPSIYQSVHSQDWDDPTDPQHTHTLSANTGVDTTTKVQTRGDTGRLCFCSFPHPYLLFLFLLLSLCVCLSFLSSPIPPPSLFPIFRNWKSLLRAAGRCG